MGSTAANRQIETRAGNGDPVLLNPDHAERRARRTRRWRHFVIASGVILVLSAYTFRRPWFHGNFGVVERGRVYRSSQPGGGLEGLIRGYKLTTILNLRGGTPAEAFYADELRLTRQFGVDFYDFPLSATRRPTRRELLMLLDLFGRCRYPLLIHCKSGADRTGMASALYLMDGPRGVAPDRAMRAFSLHYGHVGMSGTERLHEPFVEYADWLRTRRLVHTPERLRRWVEQDYVSPDASPAFRPLRPGPRESVVRRTDQAGAKARTR